MGPFYLFPTQQYGSCGPLLLSLPPSEEGQLAKKAPVGACMTLPPSPSQGEEGGPARLHDGKALSLSFSLPSSMPVSAAAATPFLAEGRAKAISASTVTLAFADRGK